MTAPTDQEVTRILRARGAAEHVIQRGRNGLISGWQEFVSRVEQGYAWGLDDYRNDLDLREHIAATGLAPLVAAEDERFRRMLTHTDRKLWDSDAPDPFWTRGFPSNASGDLLDDLREEGFA